jgi:hypothetical protein
MSVRTTLNDFLKRAREVHGDRYDYSQVNYQGMKSKVTIVCPDHGPFDQSPQKHLAGQRCRKCAGYLDGDTFIVEAGKVHDNKYDYSLIKFSKMTSKVTIRCPEHGPFSQMPFLHLDGQGCPGCAGNRPLNKSRFVADSISQHGFYYNYSRIPEEIRSDQKVEIECPEHGVFSRAQSII